jgi:nicotinamide riboside kinase
MFVAIVTFVSNVMRHGDNVMRRFFYAFIGTLAALAALAALLWGQAIAQDVDGRVIGKDADLAAIHAWVDHWYGEQTPDQDGTVMRMTVDCLRLTGNKALVTGDYGRALQGASQLKSLSGHYVRLLEKKDGKWVNTDRIGFVY